MELKKIKKTEKRQKQKKKIIFKKKERNRCEFSLKFY